MLESHTLVVFTAGANTFLAEDFGTVENLLVLTYYSLNGVKLFNKSSATEAVLVVAWFITPLVSVSKSHLAKKVNCLSTEVCNL